MRIVGGKYRGRVLAAFNGKEVRPTSGRAKEALFNILAPEISGANVLDLFCGTGGIGLEALSRGAACAHLFERDRGALAALSENAKALKLSAAAARIHRCDIFKNPPLDVRPPFDLVFLDPPYAYGAADVLGLVAQLAQEGTLAEDALIVYEHGEGSNDDVDAAAPEAGFELASRKKYGDTVVDILRRA